MGELGNFSMELDPAVKPRDDNLRVFPVCHPVA